MTLAELALPVTYAWSSTRVLVFPAALNDRLLEVQEEVADPRYNLVPAPLTDGRYLCNADLLTECVPGGFLHPAFARLNAANFGLIDVLTREEVANLIPADEPVL